MQTEIGSGLALRNFILLAMANWREGMTAFMTALRLATIFLLPVAAHALDHMPRTDSALSKHGNLLACDDTGRSISATWHAIS